MAKESSINSPDPLKEMTANLDGMQEHCSPLSRYPRKLMDTRWIHGFRAYLKLTLHLLEPSSQGKIFLPDMR